MRTTYRKDEISEVISYSAEVKEEITIWQFISDEDRRLFYGKIDLIDDDQIVIEINPEKANHDFKLIPDKTVYVKGIHLNYLFKRDTFHITNRTTLKVKTPSELKLQDFRAIDRFGYKYQDHKLITFYKERVKGGTVEELTFASPLVDICIKGCAFVLYEKDFRSISMGDRIFIRSLTDQKLEEPAPAYIRSSTKYNKFKRQG